MTDLSYECEFDSVIVLEDWLSPNKYKVKIYFDVETDNGDHQNIAFERIKIMLEDVFHNSMIISLDNPLLQTLAKKTKQRIITLPNEPLDVIVAAILYNKLNAISEGKLSIHKVKISSTQADYIWVHFDDVFAENLKDINCEYYKITEVEPWWMRRDPSTSDWFEIGKKEIKFHCQKASWDKTLQWSTESNENSKKPSWNPTIIDGGKETKH